MIILPQAPSSVVMIRPHHFLPNEQTAADNSFQCSNSSLGSKISALAFEQVSVAVEKLREAGVTVHLFEDQSTTTPDSVFPNNWFSTHSGGQIAIYPMYAENRRLERRSDIIEMLKANYRVQDVIDYSGLEYDNLFLEGTGAMVLDHTERVAYAVKSNRTDSHALERFCSHFNYEPMVFDAFDKQGNPVYHTNVLMCIGSDFVLAGIDMISNQARKKEILHRFQSAGKTVIELTEAQISGFCGNALELNTEQGRILALSTTAYALLSDKQKSMLSDQLTLLPLDVSAIETAGGSVRCMLAGIHLSKR